MSDCNIELLQRYTRYYYGHRDEFTEEERAICEKCIENESIYKLSLMCEVAIKRYEAK